MVVRYHSRIRRAPGAVSHCRALGRLRAWAVQSAVAAHCTHAGFQQSGCYGLGISQLLFVFMTIRALHVTDTILNFIEVSEVRAYVYRHRIHARRNGLKYGAHARDTG